MNPLAIHDITLPGSSGEGGGRRGNRSGFAFLQAGAAALLIVAIFLDTTMVFADDATGTIEVAPSEAAATSTAPVDVLATSTATATLDSAPSSTPPVDTATVATSSPTSTSPTSTPPENVENGSSSAMSTVEDPAVTTATSSESVASSTATSTDNTASSTTIIAADDASSTDATSTDVTSASSTDNINIDDASTTTDSTTTDALDGAISTTTDATTTITATPSSTDPLPAADPESVDTIRSQVRTELEKQVSAAYDSALQAQLAQAQKKLNETEQSDMSAMRDELTAQIKQELQAGCLTFDDGSYFCVNPESASSGAYAAPAPYANVYAAKDPQTGNEEIYAQESGAVSQITHTAYDNLQPVWNKDKTLIAWQGLVNDEWQIFVYDTTTGATQELADGATNSINPTIDGNRIAWQGWDGNWQIYTAALSGGTGGSGASWQVSEVTHDTWANVEPQLAGGLLAWQSYRAGSWQIFVDSLASGEISQVSAGNGINRDPHFLLTWQNEENGKSQSLQYDISSGAVSQLGASTTTAPAPPLPESPAQKNGATLPAGSSGSSSSTSSTASSSKSQSDGENQ